VGGPGTPFGARGMSSVRYGIRLGDLKNKQPTHTPALAPVCVDSECFNSNWKTKETDSL
jgi:hypothetical protein